MKIDEPDELPQALYEAGIRASGPADAPGWYRLTMREQFRWHSIANEAARWFEGDDPAPREAREDDPDE